MKWESWGLAEGPYGLREVTVYPGVHAHTLCVTYDYKRIGREHGSDVALVIFGIGGDSSPGVIATATVRRYAYEFDISAAAIWLQDMVRVLAKEDAL